jgi:transcriptional regulator with XRE-family HTH domain
LSFVNDGPMTPRPPIGLKIKRARERMRLTQAELGSAIGVSQKTIDNWEHDRTYPMSSIGALEALGIKLTDDDVDSYEDPDELVIRGFTRFSDEEKRALIAELRRIRRGAG